MRTWRCVVAAGLLTGLQFAAPAATAIPHPQNAVSTAQPPSGSTSLQTARRHLPVGFTAYETARYVVLSDAAPTDAWAQTRRLERTHDEYQRVMRRLGVRPRPIRHKLVCVLFRDRNTYRRFAARYDDVDDPWIAGHYSPRHDRVVLYVATANPSVVDAQARIIDMQGDVASIDEEAHLAHRAGQAQRADSLRRHARQYEEHLQQERQRVQQFAERIDIATTAHEGVHQLLFHTDVQNRTVSYPIWISEGLATAFETESPTSGFGPDYEYAPRRQAFDELLQQNRLIPLADLVGWSAMPSREELVHAAYHQSYALLTWLFRNERAALTRYLRDLSGEPAGPVPADRARQLFTKAFGPIDRMERRWHRAEMARLKPGRRR